MIWELILIVAVIITILGLIRDIGDGNRLGIRLNVIVLFIILALNWALNWPLLQIIFAYP